MIAPVIRLRRATVVLGVLACGQTAPIVDAGPDAAPDVPITGCVGPEAITPPSQDCSPGSAGGKTCVGAGWFCLPPWSTAQGMAFSENFTAIPPTAAYTDGFRIDTGEVTNQSYAAFVQAMSAAPPPDECGYTAIKGQGDPETGTVHQKSGWTSGVYDPALADHPVLCVTRAEAATYCNYAHGRLPSAVEWMKAARGPAPNQTRFPWGNSPPVDSDTVSYNSQDHMIWMAMIGDGSIQTGSVLGPTAGASLYGVVGLSGNASEWLATCQEDLPITSGSVIRPPTTFKPMCAAAVLAAGTSWLSAQAVPFAAAAASIFAATQGATGTRRFSAMVPDLVGASFLNNVFDEQLAMPLPGAGTDPAGNDLRDWRVGFRCAYDL